MAQPVTRQYAGLISGVLAALAILGGLWHAAYRAPSAAVVEPAAVTNPAEAWQTKAVRVVDGHITASRHSDEPGFPAVNCIVPPDELYDLPAGKGEIVSLQGAAVKTAPAKQVTWLQDSDMVFGIQLYGHKRCYPRNILARHCLINDTLAGEPILIYFDPPSDACVAFMRPEKGGAAYSFAASGLGYRGMGLPYDEQTESLWDPLGGEAIVGTAVGQAAKLKQIAGEWMTWAAWQELWPDTTVLSRDTGHEYDYSFDPYTRVQGPDGEPLSYYESELLLAPEELSDQSGTMADKAEVLGVMLLDEALAVPVAEALAGAGDEPRTFTQDSRFGQLELKVDPEAQRLYLTMPGNVRPAQVRMFWYAWRARHPDTDVWRIEGETEQES